VFTVSVWLGGQKSHYCIGLAVEGFSPATTHTRQPLLARSSQSGVLALLQPLTDSVIIKVIFDDSPWRPGLRIEAVRRFKQSTKQFEVKSQK
jgi:hypothetical protein